MTEAEWLACTDPEPMLTYLYGKGRQRKLRLYLCACLQRVPLLDGGTAWVTLGPACRDTVAVAEAFADGVASAADVERARSAAGRLRWEAEAAMFGHWEGTADPAEYLAHATQFDAASTCEQATKAEVRPRYRSSWSGRVWELVSLEPGEVEPSRTRLARHQLLLDIIGNPFSPVPLIRSWRTPKVAALAREIYKRQTFDQLPVLAGALEEAGCHEAALVEHCRTRGDHVRGCWALDELLEKD